MSSEYAVTMATRRYEQRLRAQTAADTRRRVLDALYDQLREAPAQPISVDGIARTAGVARSTIYVIFGSRAGLFDAFAADVLERGGFQRVLDAVADPDPCVHLRGGITGGVHTFAAHRDVFRALTSMAEVDADAFGGAMQRSDERRAKGMMRLARRLARHGLLREGLSAKRAADRLWVLTSFDAFDLLYDGRALPEDEVARVLVEMAERSVLASGGGSVAVELQGRAPSEATPVEAGGREVRVSSPDRVIFPPTDHSPAVTKLDVVNYYVAVEDGIMRALWRRPTTLERWPKGVHPGIVLSTREKGGGDAFFQKRIPKGAPDYVETARIEFPSGRHADEICPTEIAVVAWAAHMGTITFHPWPVRSDDVDHPTSSASISTRNPGPTSPTPCEWPPRRASCWG